MKSQRINADKPHLWKADVAASVDQFNQWFMQFAPEAFRTTRVETTQHVKAALIGEGVHLCATLLWPATMTAPWL